MLFNSLDFAIFAPLVFLIYWSIPRRHHRLQNGFLLAASYLFYGWWDWRFLFLLAFSSGVDYAVGLALGKFEGRGKRVALLILSLTVNLGFLGFFKYFNFFMHHFTQAFSFFGHPIEDPFLLKIILPVGISFYTFQTMSYTIDIFRKQMTPTRDPVAFFAFVSFFPQLVAGPIERAHHLLPQFFEPRKFDYPLAVDGARRMLWGFFKKIVIADNCGIVVDEIFGNYSQYGGSVRFLGLLLFAFQIYGDFSGYSDIAIGVARLFGFRLMQNFATPYFSRDIAEFWRRWHISLSTWFRDYVYIPLGGNRASNLKGIRNIFIVFLLSGFWHGANVTFIIWGALNALYYLPLFLIKKHRKHTDTVAQGRLLPGVTDVMKMATTFFLTLLAWAFFRSPTVGDALAYLGGMASWTLFEKPPLLPLKVLALVGLLVIWEWAQRHKEHPLQLSAKMPKWLRWAIYYGFTSLIFLMGHSERPFIYFQF